MSFITGQVRKFSNYYKKNGFFWLCRHIFTNLFHYSKWAVFETEMYENYEILKAKIPVTVRPLSKSEEDIDRMTKFWPEVYNPPFATPQNIRNLITQRLSVGERCIIAEHDGEIICMFWDGFHNAHIYTPYEKKRGIGPDEVLGYWGFCAENYRGSHVMNEIRSENWDYLLKNNYKKIITYVRYENQPAVKVSKRLDGKLVNKVYCLRIFGFPLVLLTDASD